MILFFAFGPMIVYFMILFYVGLFISGDQNVLNEYLILLSWYYQILIFYTFFKFFKKN